MHASWYSDVDAVQSISEQNEHLSESFYGLNRRTDTISLWSTSIFYGAKIQKNGAKILNAQNEGETKGQNEWVQNMEI